MRDTRCLELITSAGGWSSHRCLRPGKFKVAYTRNPGAQKVIGYRCGIHAKRYENKEPLAKKALSDE